MRRFLPLFPPAVLVLALWPLESKALSSIPDVLAGRGLEQLVYYVPVYCGVVALPGYVYLVFRQPTKAGLGILGRLWITSSLFLASIAFLFGTFAAMAMPIAVPVVLLCFIISVSLLIRFEAK